jgi:hypothetical protein
VLSCVSGHGLQFDPQRELRNWGHKVCIFAFNPVYVN